MPWQRLEKAAASRRTPKAVHAASYSVTGSLMSFDSSTCFGAPCFATAIIALLEQARIQTRQTEKGWQIDVQLNGPIDVESQF